MLGVMADYNTEREYDNHNELYLTNDEVHFLLEAATDLLGFYRVGNIDKDIYPKPEQLDVITLVNVLNRYKDAVH